MGASTRPRDASAPAPELSLPRLLAAQARTNGAKPFLVTLPGPDGRGSELTFSQVQEQVDRLAGLLRQLRLPAAAPVALMLPNDGRAVIALTAVMEAGLSAVLVPMAAPQPMLAQALEQAKAAALITVSRWAGLETAEMARTLAAGLYGLRFVAAFGANAPDGVIPIDNLAATWAQDARLSGTEQASTLVWTVDFGPAGKGPVRVVSRKTNDLVAASLPVVAITGMRAGERILSTMAPDDLAGVVSGLVPSLMTGIPLVMLPLFDSTTLLAEIGRASGVHLVVPAAIEQAIDDAGLLQDGNLASVMLTHRAPWQRRQSPPRAAGVLMVDLIALGEDCLCAREREVTSRGIPLDGAVTPLNGGISLLLLAIGSPGTRGASAGRLSVTGRAGTVRDPGQATAGGWRMLDWTAQCEDGAIVAIRPL